MKIDNYSLRLTKLKQVFAKAHQAKENNKPPNPLRTGGHIFIKNITEVYSHSISGQL